jgi:WD40 repeat protein
MTSVAFSPDGQHLALAGADNSTSVIDTESGGPVFRSELNADWVMQLAFSPDGKQIASASRDKTVRVLDAKTGGLEQTYAGHGGAVFAVLFIRDGKGVLSGGRDRSIHWWQESDGKKIADSGSLPGEIVRLLLVGDRIIAGLNNGEIREYRANGKRLEFVRKIGQHGDSVSALAANRSGKTLASAGFDGKIRLWNLEQAALEREFPALPGLPKTK